jgi:two-component system, NarL family, nitrate/nitrite response regulator NarL
MSSEPSVPTFIIQIDGLFREGLRLTLSRTRFRPQAYLTELDDLREVPSDRPVLFIVGIRQKGHSICKRIRVQYPFALIVAIGDDSNSRYLANALDDGANAVLLNSIKPNALVDSLHAVVNGALVVIDARLWPLEIQPRVEEQMLPSTQQVSPSIPSVTSWEYDEEQDAMRQFSAREIEILERIVRGDSNKHVARFFKIAEPTVKAHVKTIFRKIGASNRTQAAFWALNHRLFEGLNSVPRDLPELQAEARRDSRRHNGPTSHH